MTQRLAPVSPWAARYVDQDDIEEDWQHVLPPERGYRKPERPFAERVAAFQAQQRAKAGPLFRQAWKLWAIGWAGLFLCWLPYHLGTICWVAGVLFLLAGHGVWRSAMEARLGYTVQPEPEDLTL